MKPLNIKGFREELSYTQEELAAELGVTRNTIVNWESGRKMAGATHKRVQKFMLEKLGFENASQEDVSQSTHKITNYKPSNFEELIPFWEIDFIAGNAFDAIDNQQANPDYFLDIPDFRGCQAFRAYSDSMEGMIKSGSILFATKVDRWLEHLEYGQVYGIVCHDGRKYLKYIRRYRENPREYFLLESENKAYDEFEMPKSAIRSIWLIHGHLSKRI